MNKNIKTTWQVRVKSGSPRLIISGEFHQEFEINPGSDEKWMARMLRRAMRRLISESEYKKNTKKE